MRKLSQVVVALVAVSAMVVALYFSLRDDKAPRSVAPATTADVSSSLLTGASVSIDASSARSEAESASQQFGDDHHQHAATAWNMVRVMGRVLDAGSGSPIAARVTIADRSADTNPAHGRFTLDLPEPANELRVTARGYHALELEFEASDAFVDLGSLELTREHAIVVRVVDAHGTAVPGAELRGRPLEWPDEYREQHASGMLEVQEGALLAECDAHGVAELAIGAAMGVFATDASGVSELALIEPNAVEVELVVQRIGTTMLRAVDDQTGEPLAGLQLDLSLRDAEAYLRCVRETNAAGELIASLPPGNYDVGVGPRDVQTRFIVNELGKRNHGDSIVHANESEIPIVRLRADPYLTVRAIDAQTGEPLLSMVTWLEMIRPSGESAGNADHARRSSERGGYRIGHSLLSAIRLRLWIHAPGYVAHGFMLPHEDLETEADDFVVELQPTLPKLLHLLVDPGSRPYVGRFSARDMSSGRRLFHGENLTGGVILDGWDGGEVQLRAGDYDATLATIPVETLASTDELVVRLEALAQVIVEGVPENAPPIYCATALGKGRVAGVRIANEMHFADLAPGRAVVGPRALVDGWRVLLQSMRTHGGLGGHDTSVPTPPVYPYELLPGETLRIPWDPTWHHIATIEGRVIATGIDLSELGVAAIYGPWPQPAALPLAPVDANGGFVLHDLEAEPYAILVRSHAEDPGGHFGMSHDETTQRNLASGPPGETIYVNCTSVELEIPESLLGETAWVNWTFGSAAPPELEQHASITLRDLQRTVLLPQVPCGARELTIRFHHVERKLRRIPLSLVTGSRFKATLED